MSAPGRAETQAVVVPDLGEVQDAVVIDVLVGVGDRIEVDTPLITLESEKATIDVPSTAAGVVTQLTVRNGDKVGKGAPILVVSGALIGLYFFSIGLAYVVAPKRTDETSG